MSKRRHISLRVKLAAMLCTVVRDDGTGRLAPVISHADAKKMTPDAVLARFDWDHWPTAKAFGGTDDFWNLRPLLREDHRRKTAKRDIPAIAKSKRINPAAWGLPVEVRGDLADGPTLKEHPKRRWPSRPFPKRPKKPRGNAR